MGRRGEREAAGEGEMEPAEGRGRVCGSDGGGALLGAGREKKNIVHPEKKKNNRGLRSLQVFFFFFPISLLILFYGENRCVS